MSHPEIGSGDGVSAQLLLKISTDVAVLVTDVAVIKEQTRAISDHEARIRELRAEVPPELAKRLGALEAQGARDRGGRDWLARAFGGLGIAAAVGDTLAHFIHR